MAQRNTAPKLTPKQLALRDLEEARTLLSVHVHLASEEWNPRVLVRQSMQKHLWAWVSAAAVGGLVLWRVLVPAPRAKIGRDISGASAKKSGLIALLMTPMLGMARQAALKYGSSFLQSYLQNHLSRHEGSPAPVRETNSHV
jgi:hypothetical protein